MSQRIAEAVFASPHQGDPRLLFAAPAGTSGNLGVGGYDTERNRNYIMYLFTGGGYGGFQGGDGLSNGCSTIGISKMPPVEVLEQFYPGAVRGVLAARGLGRRREFRGGFGINYAIKLRRGEAPVSMVMDHGRTGPQGVLGGAPDGVNTVKGEARAARPTVHRIFPRIRTSTSVPATWCACLTPGGGGFGDPAKTRSRAAIARDVAHRLPQTRSRQARSSAPGKLRNEAFPTSWLRCPIVPSRPERRSLRRSDPGTHVRGVDRFLRRRYAGRARSTR